MPVRMSSPYREIEGVSLFEAVDEGGALIEGPRVAIVGLIHGNEIVGDVVLSRLEVEAHRDLQAGSVLLVRANLRAFEARRRHTSEGVDLNRQWDADRLAHLASRPRETLCYEERRALELAPLLAPCDAILDLHSTSRPSQAFLVMRDDQAHASVAANLGVSHLVTGLHEAAVLDGGVCPDVGLEPGERHRRVGFTFESGQHADPTNVDRAHAVCQRFLHGFRLWGDAPAVPAGLEPRLFEVVDRFLQVPHGHVPWRFVGFEGGEEGAGRRGAPRVLASFDTIEADEIVLKRGDDGVHRAPMAFTMLLPTPRADPGTDLYYVCQPRAALPARSRSHDEARIEAEGIERMLDLLDDDEFARGYSGLAFDPRLALDRCAELVGRTVRLPFGHPHRKVTVVGPGELFGGEAERRAGLRYRAAMRRVLAEGVPVERFQLLRGASLAMFRSLTDASMSRLLAERSERSGTGGTKLWLSAQQPPNISLLVCGDIDHALADGDTRELRVGLVVEAIAPAPDGDFAQVKVARFGLFSTRPELLATVQRLLEALREEHRVMISRPPLSNDAAVASLVGADGALYPVADPDVLTGLRDALYRVQLTAWRDALVGPAVAGRIADGLDADDVGKWLASVMSATGILDAAALKHLLLRADPDGGIWVDPQALDYALSTAYPGGPNVESRRTVPLPAPAHGRPIPAQPVFGDRLDADDIERWIGWKRFVRQTQTLPDTRGRDMDLAFEERAIGVQAARILRRARDIGRERPGEVLVVIAGSGANPGGSRPGGAALVGSHAEVLLDPNVRYLRVQFAQQTYLAWWKEQVEVLAHRPAGSSVAVQWEAAHGAAIHSLIVATRAPGAVVDDPWTLEGWTMDSACLLVSPLRGHGERTERLGVLSQGGRELHNQEVLHFARAHVQAQLRQHGARVHAPDGLVDASAFEHLLIEQMTTWILKIRKLAAEAAEVPPAGVARIAWVASQLGLVDEGLAAGIAGALDDAGDAEALARGIWDGPSPTA